MLKRYFYKIIVTVLFFSALIYSRTVFAASINVVPGTKIGAYNVVVSLDQNESFNAVSGTVILNEHASPAPTIEKDDSIIPLWINEPVVSGNSINFSGIIPGGFSVLYDQFSGKSQNRGELFSIVFPFIPNVYEYIFAVKDVKIYANDGYGTETDIPPKIFDLRISSNNNLPQGNQIPPGSSGSADSRPIFLLFLVIFLIICFYSVKRARWRVRRIDRK